MDHSKALIRIIDDEFDVRQALALLLDCDGRRTVSYSSAEDFLRDDLFSEPGCLLCDIRMPGMTGQQLFEEMGKRGILLPIIFITGHGDIEMAVDALQNGASDFLIKPVKEDKLFRAIENALSRVDFQTEQEYQRRVQMLSEREREILKFMFQDLDTKVISERLNISDRTVQGHRWRIYQKIGLNSMSDIRRNISREWL